MRKKISIAPGINRPHSRNVLPAGYPKRIGPFIYFDHLGPYDFPKNRSVHIPPHPHAGISTISYLFEGEGNHKDSLGNALEAEPGRVNWMNAGNGIVHSEGTSRSFSTTGGKLLGFQIWILGSDRERSNGATFQTYSREELPSFNSGTSTIHLIAGNYSQQSSPVQTDQELLLMGIESEGEELLLTLDPASEYLIYCLEGEFRVEEHTLRTGEGIIVDATDALSLLANKATRILVAGGKPIPTKPVSSGSLVAGSTEELQAYIDTWNTHGFGSVPTERE